VICLADSDRANIVHWSSIKCKRVTRSVLSAELYGMAHGFDIGAALKATLSNILGIPVPLVLCTDSKSLYDCLVRLGTTQEKRLMIDVMSLRQSYERREVTEVKWIHGVNNPADSMTKSLKKRLAPTNRIRKLEVVRSPTQLIMPYSSTSSLPSFYSPRSPFFLLRPRTIQRGQSTTASGMPCCLAPRNATVHTSET
jgi:hypothetical protein